MKKSFKISLSLLACLTLGSTILPAANADDAITTIYTNRKPARAAKPIYRQRKLIMRQAKRQANKWVYRKFRKSLARIIKANRRSVRDEPVMPDNHSYTNARWFKDGLSKRNLKDRNWVAYHESGHRWYVLSYGGVCIGYFQLNPEYLGKKHGHTNLNPKHQVQIADAYVKVRYGSWMNAKRFWEAHNWY